MLVPRVWESDRLKSNWCRRCLERSHSASEPICEQILQELTSGINEGLILRVRSSNTKQQVLQLQTRKNTEQFTLYTERKDER